MILFDGNGNDARIVIRLRLSSREINVTLNPKPNGPRSRNRSPIPKSGSEVGSLDVWVIRQLLGCPCQNNRPLFHHVTVIDDWEDRLSVLLRDQYRNSSLGVDLFNRLNQSRLHRWAKPH